MDFWFGYLSGLVVVIALMSVVWLASVYLADSSIIDIFWGVGFVLATYFYLITFETSLGAMQWLLLALVSIWGARLSFYIFWRNKGKPEDPRYQNFRRKYGASYWWQSLFRVYWLQAVLVWIISAPLAVAMFATAQELSFLAIMGTLIWAFGFYFESVGDYQMARFKANHENQGKVMDQGLWGLTRHPNYFGDALQWWGFFVIVLSVNYGWLTIFSPVLMSIFLLKVSGVTLLESELKQRKPEYANYIAKVPAFVPWPRFFKK